MNVFSSLPEKYQTWYYPLRTSFPSYREKYLDETIGKNELQSSSERDDFIQLIFKSLSLDIHEKKKVLKAYRDLDQFQIDSLIDVFDEEKKKFEDLNSEHPDDVYKLYLRSVMNWVFALEEIDNPELVVLDFVNDTEVDENILNSCLKLVKEHTSDEKYIYFFEVFKDEFKIDELHWNSYLIKLSNIKEFDRLSNIKIPDYLDVSFINACRTSYLLRSFAFYNINSTHIMEIYNFLRTQKSKIIRSQFTYDLFFYLLYKNNDLEKHIYRIVDVFLSKSRNLKSNENELEYLSRHFEYIITLMLFFDSETRNDIYDYIYREFKEKIDNETNDKKSHYVETFFIENENVITNTVKLFSMYKEGTSKLFKLINNESYGYFIKLDDSFLTLSQIIYLNNDNKEYKKRAIDTIISNKNLSNEDFLHICLSLQANGNEYLSEYLLDNLPLTNEKSCLKELYSTLSDDKKILSINFIEKMQSKISEKLSDYSVIDLDELIDLDEPDLFDLDDFELSD